MSDQVKAAAIIGAAIVVAVVAAASILAYFSPMQTCVRGGYAAAEARAAAAGRKENPQLRNIERTCAQALSPSTTVWAD